MRSTTSQSYLQKVIAAAEEDAKAFIATVNGLPKHLFPRNTSVAESKSKLRELSQLLEFSKTWHEAEQKPLEEASRLLRIQTTDSHYLEKTLAARLETVRVEAEAMHKKNAASWNDIIKSAKTEIEKGPGFFGRMVSGGFTKHQDWMKKHSTAGRMGFAVAELTLGNVLTAVGGQWLSQGISGLKQKQMQQHTTDEKGGRITDTVLVMSPMSKTERVLKTALGGASAGIGIAATGMGFYNLFFSTESN